MSTYYVLDRSLDTPEISLFILISSSLTPLTNCLFCCCLNSMSNYNRNFFSNYQAILERTSDLLYTATDRRAFFKEVTFLIPKSWSVTQWTTIKGMKKTRTLSIKDADFVLKGSGKTEFVAICRSLKHTQRPTQTT